MILLFVVVFQELHNVKIYRIIVLFNNFTPEKEIAQQFAKVFDISSGFFKNISLFFCKIYRFM